MGRGPMGALLVCPYCGKRNDQQAPVLRHRNGTVVTDAPTDVPKQVAMCAACGGMAVAEPSMVGFALRMPTLVEMTEIDEDPLFAKLRQGFRDAFDREPEPWRL